jgi:hypothetical protein
MISLSLINSILLDGMTSFPWGWLLSVLIPELIDLFPGLLTEVFMCHERGLAMWVPSGDRFTSNRRPTNVRSIGEFAALSSRQAGSRFTRVNREGATCRGSGTIHQPGDNNGWSKTRPDVTGSSDSPILIEPDVVRVRAEERRRERQSKARPSVMHSPESLPKLKKALCVVVDPVSTASKPSTSAEAGLPQLVTRRRWASLPPVEQKVRAAKLLKRLKRRKLSKRMARATKREEAKNRLVTHKKTAIMKVAEEKHRVTDAQVQTNTPRLPTPLVMDRMIPAVLPSLFKVTGSTARGSTITYGPSSTPTFDDALFENLFGDNDNGDGAGVGQ